MHASREEAGNSTVQKCCERRCFRAVFLDNHLEVVHEQTKCAKRIFLWGTVIFTLGFVGFAIYVLVIAGRCYGQCKIHAWIPSYLLLAALAEMARMPAYFVWLFDRDPDDLSFNAFDIYRLASSSTLVSVSIFGSIVVFPYVTDFQDTWHHKRVDQCPCFYWSFWWLAGTWFSLFFNFSFNWLMYAITPCMNRMIEERERRYYEYWSRYDEERQHEEANQRQRRSENLNTKVPHVPSVRHEQNEKVPPKKPNAPTEDNIKSLK